jgi:transposase
MSTEVRLRELSDEERSTITRLARSRTDEARLVQRARLIELLARGERPGAVARRVGMSRNQLYLWLHRFNNEGPEGLRDRPRRGRPPTYSPEQVAVVIATALSDPRDLGLDFGCWTLDRLEAYLNEHRGIAIRRSRIDEVLLAEGLRWRKQETWFGERVDPEFAEKRGSSSGPTPTRRPARSSSASTRWAPSRPRASRAGRSSAPGPASRPTAAAAPPGGPGRRPTTGAAARAASSAPSSRPRAKP